MRFQRTAVLVLMLLLLPTFAGAQAAPGGLRGQISDPSGAVIPDASITVTSPSGQATTVTSNRQGAYEFKALPPGMYKLAVTAKGFLSYEQPEVAISASGGLKLDIPLEIEVKPERVVVQEQNTNVDVTAANNANSIVLKGADLDALSDDPDELQSDLQALAGPSAGPNGGQIYIDGFTNGQLPPKSSIREIRINQNPFSAEFDRLGFGRIEILTKPGTDKYHGQFFLNLNNAALNARNPFVTQQPGYHSEQYNGNFGGPLSKKASFFFNVERRSINETAIVNAVVLDSALNEVPFNQAVPNPRMRTSISPRLDYQVSTNNTLTARYQFTRSSDTGDGIGQFNLATQGYDTDNQEQLLQVSDTQVFPPNLVNETRFQYIRDRNQQASQLFQATISVPGAFTSGGNRMGQSLNNTDRYELQNYTSLQKGKHYVRFGGRLRAVQNGNQSNSNFNGTFTFSGSRAPQLDAANQVVLDANGQPALVNITSLDSYRRTLLFQQLSYSPAQIRALGGGASQFTITTGQPLGSVTQVDAGLYAEDDWHIRQNITLSLGLRFETQDNINDQADFAPRIGFAWGIGRGKTAPKTVLRAGFGMFYDRFSQDLVLQAERLNGVTQQQYLVKQPDFFPNVPAVSALVGAQTAGTIYQIDPHLHAPYTIQWASSLEHQVWKNATLAVTYLHSHGVHNLLTRNINTPLPGTYDPNVLGSGAYPLGNTSIVNQYSSEGVFKQNQLITNLSIRSGTKLTLTGFYVLNYANGNTSGASTFPANPYNLIADYGRANFDVRHRVTIISTFSAPLGLRFSPFIIVSSAPPFNITTGRDLNGDSVIGNDRPAFATDLTRPTVVQATWGTFDTSPLPGATIIPVNYGAGHGQVSVNMRVGRTFGFGKVAEGSGGQRGGRGGFGGPGGPGGPGGGGGPRGGPGGGMGPRGLAGGGGFGGGPTVSHRYNMTVSASARNLFNHVNLGSPIGNLDSPLFGQSNTITGGFGPGGGSPASNRRIEMQVQFSF